MGVVILTFVGKPFTIKTQNGHKTSKLMAEEKSSLSSAKKKSAIICTA